MSTIKNSSMKMVWLTLALPLLLVFNIAFAQVELNSTGAAGAYAVTFPANFTLTNGLEITFKANHTTPGSATLNVNGTGALPITKQGTISLASGDIVSGQVVKVVYDGSRYQVISDMPSSGGSIGTGTAFYSTRWVTATTIGTGAFSDDGTNVGLGTTSSPSYRLNISTAGAVTGMQVLNTGTSGSGFFSISNAANTSSVLQATTSGLGHAGQFAITNSSNANYAVRADHAGSGASVAGLMSGTGQAGLFQISNAANTQIALTAQTNGNGGRALQVNHTGTSGYGMVLSHTSSANSNDAIWVNNGSSGVGVNINSTFASNPNPALLINHAGTGYGAYINLTNGSNTGDGLYVSTSGTGNAGNFNGKLRTTTFQMTNGATSGYVLTSDATGNATWQAAPTASAWSLTGNTGLNATTNYIGTNDAVPFIVRTNGTEAFRVNSNQNLLLGTTNPDGRLTIRGNNSLAGQNAISITNNTPEGMFFVRNDKTAGFGFGPSDASTSPILTVKGQTTDATGWALNVVDNTYSPMLTVRNDKMVGLGTDAPSHQLTLKGTPFSSTQGPNMAFYAEDAYPELSSLVYNHGDQWLMFNGYYDGNLRGSSNSYNPFSLSHSGGYFGLYYAAIPTTAGDIVNYNPGVLLDGNGDAGIGAYPNPGYRLTVNGSIDIGGAIAASGWYGNPGEVLTSNGFAAPTWTAISGLSGGTTNYIPKWTSSNTLSSTSLLYDSGTRIGVKTTAPASTLHVHETSGLLQFRLTNATTGTTGADGFSIGSSAADVFVQNHENADMSFMTNGSYRMTIDAGGNIAVGTSTTPNTKLDIAGDISTRETVFNTSTSPISNFGIGATSFVTVTGQLGDWSITGIANGFDGKILRIYNNTTFNMTLQNESATSIAANRIVTGTGANASIAGEGIITLIYSGNKQRWVIDGSSEPISGSGPWTKTGSLVSLTTSSDNVQIGTQSSGDKLVVEGFIKAKSAGTAGVTIDKGSTASNGYVVYQTAGSDRYVAGLMADDNYSIYYWPGGREDLTILSTSGFVGIGSTNPLSKLDVSGNASIGAGYSTTAAPTNGLQVEGNVGIGAISTNLIGKLTVRGSSSAVNGVDGVFLDIMNDNANTVNTLAGIRFGNYPASPSNPYLPTGIFMRSTGETFGRGDLLFITGTTGGLANTAQTRMTIESNGNVGVGMNPVKLFTVGVSPSSNISLYSTTMEANRGTSYAPRWNMGVGFGETSYQISNDNWITPITEYVFGTSQSSNSFRSGTDNQKSLGTASARWTAVYAVNGTIQTSDGRDKENIQPIHYGLSTIMNLKPVSYNWKTDSRKTKKIGLIAQDVLPLVKEVVYDGKNDPEQPEFIKNEAGELVKNHAYSDRLGINYSDLIPVLIKATQEQQLLIEKQQKQIDELLNKIQNLENK